MALPEVELTRRASPTDERADAPRRRSRRTTSTSAGSSRGAASTSRRSRARATAFRVAVPVLGRRHRRHALRPLSRARRAAHTCSRSWTTAPSCSALVRVTPGISLHIPWDRPERPRGAARATPQARGLFFDSMNSNTFQDQPGQAHSYKFGSLSHTDPAVRRQAIEHNLECLDDRRGARRDARTPCGSATAATFPGQIHLRRVARSLSRHRCAAIYAALPDGWRLFIEHKLYEPAFYSTVLNDWGTSYYCARELGERAFSLVDLGHHAPNVNIEQIVARLIQFGKLGGFHFNDSKYGDDDLDAGSIKPFQLFLVFNELVDAELEGVPGFAPGLHARPVAQRHRSARVADDERDRGGARLRPGAPRRSRGARGRAAAQRRARWRCRR